MSVILVHPSGIDLPVEQKKLILRVIRANQKDKNYLMSMDEWSLIEDLVESDPEVDAYYASLVYKLLL